jgi:hypothetical protein
MIYIPNVCPKRLFYQTGGSTSFIKEKKSRIQPMPHTELPVFFYANGFAVIRTTEKSEDNLQKAPGQAGAAGDGAQAQQLKTIPSLEFKRDLYGRGSQQM